MRSRHIGLLFALTFAPLASAQSIRVSTEMAPPSPGAGPAPLGVSAANFWFGSQLAYGFPDNAAFADNVLVNGSVRYFLSDSKERDRWGLPVIANLSAISATDKAEEVAAKLSEILRSSQGLQAGLQYYLCFDPGAFLAPTVFAMATYKVNGAKTQADADDVRFLHQLRVSVGGEIALGLKVAQSPMTLTLSPTFVVPLNGADFDAVLGADRRPLGLIEATVVLPVAHGFGLLLEGHGGLSTTGVGTWGGRFGLIFAATTAQ